MTRERHRRQRPPGLPSGWTTCRARQMRPAHGPGLLPEFNWLCAASSKGTAQGVASGVHWLRCPFLRLNALHTLGRALHSHDALRLNPTPFPLRANDRIKPSEHLHLWTRPDRSGEWIHMFEMIGSIIR